MKPTSGRFGGVLRSVAGFRPKPLVRDFTVGEPQLPAGMELPTLHEAADDAPAKCYSADEAGQIGGLVTTEKAPACAGLCRTRRPTARGRWDSIVSEDAALARDARGHTPSPPSNSGKPPSGLHTVTL